MFITFEGINGSGKSTQSKMLYDFLVKQGKDVVLTKEPSTMNDFCTKIRKIIVETKDISKDTEMFLLFASRKEHLDKVILPSLSKGKIVICDRYIDSTFAYQCCDDYTKFKLVEKIHKEMGGIMPDRTFLIDITVSESEQRLAPIIYTNDIRIDNGYKKYDELSSEHMQKILNTYHYIAKNNPERIKIIDGLKSKEEICNQIIEELNIK